MRQPGRPRSKKAWAKWGKLISQQAKSGQTVAGFCQVRGLCAPHFFAWKKKLSQAGAVKFVEVRVAATTPTVRVENAGAIEVQLHHGRSLRVGPGFDAAHLRAVLAVLESEA